MTSVRWHQFVQPYEPRELDPDPFYDLADRATPLPSESLPVPPEQSGTRHIHGKEPTWLTLAN